MTSSKSWQVAIAAWALIVADEAGGSVVCGVALAHDGGFEIRSTESDGGVPRECLPCQ